MAELLYDVVVHTTDGTTYIQRNVSYQIALETAAVLLSEGYDAEIVESFEEPLENE